MEKERPLNKAVITGATGMIGATLAELLAGSGVEVTALVRPGSAKLHNLDAAAETGNLKIVECALEDIPDLPEDDRTDAWFHFGWDGVYGSARNDETLQQANVEITARALEKAARCGAHSFLFAGSQAEYGPVSGVLTPDTPMHPETAYGRAKMAAEKMCVPLSDELHIRFIPVRILSVYGPYDNDYTLIMTALRAFLSGTHQSFTKGEQVWDYLYAADAAEAFRLLAKYGRHRKGYVLGSGSPRTLKEYILAARDCVDPSIMPGIGELPYRENQVMHLTADISALKQDTGFVPAVDFETGIRKTAEWLKNRTAEN